MTQHSAAAHSCGGWPQETDCKGGLTHTEWCDPCTELEDRLHPRAFRPEAVSHSALGGMREQYSEKACNVTAALGWAADGFVTAARLAAGQQCASPPIHRCAAAAALRLEVQLLHIVDAVWRCVEWSSELSMPQLCRALQQLISGVSL